MYDSDLYLSLCPDQSEFKIKIDEAAKQNSGHFDRIDGKIWVEFSGSHRLDNCGLSSC